MGRKFFVGGNWVCEGARDEMEKIVNILNDGKVPPPDVVEVVVGPPDFLLQSVKRLMRPDFHVAAQNCGKKGASEINSEEVPCWVENGGVPVEVSAECLKKLDVQWVILGQSERRFLVGETNEAVAEKVAYALSYGLKVIVCVCDTLRQRKDGLSVELLCKQINAIAEKVEDWTNIVLAYETVRTVNLGKKDASPAEAQEMHHELRRWIDENIGHDIASSIRIVYAGTVDCTNANELAAEPDIDGFLVVDVVSLRPEFIDIINASLVKKA